MKQERETADITPLQTAIEMMAESIGLTVSDWFIVVGGTQGGRDVVVGSSQGLPTVGSVFSLVHAFLMQEQLHRIEREEKNG